MKRLLLLGVLLWAARVGADPAATSCTACHGDPSLAGEASKQIVTAFHDDVHAGVGLSCQDCHGGNPDPALAADPAAAMDANYGPNPFRGAPQRRDVPAFCGRCHSDASYMKGFRPDARVDQEREYRTSRHGELLATGDTKVATCIDCHGVHGILAPKDVRSPVYPRRVADTCARCHADAKRMEGYTLPDGRPLPVDQYARWRQSVHAEALLDKGDLSAPTCNDCHGNHGAAPPGLESIAFVCGQCHGREAELFRASPKREMFHTHAEFMESVGAAGCAACHTPAPPAASRAEPIAFTECATCHGQHGVVRPSVAMLAPLPPIPCDFCHVDTPEGGPAPVGGQRRFEAMRDKLLAQAAAQKLEGTALFDWLVDQALQLPTHTLSGRLENGKPVLRPEFNRLFTKFRIGKTYYTYQDPKTGKTARAPVVRCSDCHLEHPADALPPTGFRTAAAFVDHMRSLTTVTARAERALLAARRGGVETRQVLPEIDQAVDAQIQLEVLLHTFSAAADGPFMERYKTGSEHAKSALEAAEEALKELAFRRRGLVVFLGLVALVLVALGLKIRQLSRQDDAG
jgi:hypothetical protein